MINKDYTELAKRIIGEFLKEIIADDKLVVRELERKSGVSSHIIYSILNGSANYTIDSLIALFGAMEIRLELMKKDIRKSFPDISDN